MTANLVKVLRLKPVGRKRVREQAMNISEPIKVMIVDDHPIVRSGLGTMLRAFDDLELVSEASSGSIALAKCQETTPDVILMDMVMPEMDGLETTRTILDQYPSVKIIMLTSFTKESMVQDALEAGATSYLLKDVPIDELADAIRLAYADQPTLSPEATRSLIKSKKNLPEEYDSGLSTREKQVLALVVEGMSNEEIAEKLYISQATVRHHVSACINKLGAANRTQAAVLAVKHNLI